MRRRRIDDASKGSNTTTKAAADWQRSWRMDNNNGVLIFIYCGLLTETLSRLCLVSVLLWYFFHQIPYFSFTTWNTISTAIMRKIFLYQMYTNIAYLPPTYRRVKKIRVIIINKNVRKSLARKNGNDNPIRSWNESVTCEYVPGW